MTQTQKMLSSLKLSFVFVDMLFSRYLIVGAGFINRRVSQTRLIHCALCLTSLGLIYITLATHIRCITRKCDSGNNLKLLKYVGDRWILRYFKCICLFVY